MEKKENKSYNKKIILSIALIVLLLVSVIGITYAIFTYSKEGEVKNTVRTGDLTFSYVETSSGISLENAMPISDEIGKKLDSSENGYFDFNVSCKIAGTSIIQYEVYAKKQEVKNEIEEKNVKIYLTDGTSDQPLSGYDVEVPTYNSLKNSLSDQEGKQLYYGSFTSSGVQKFRLRMWLKEEYNVPATGEQFKIKVNVDAISN